MIAQQLIAQGVFRDADHAIAELERLRDDPVLGAILAGIEADMQALVLAAKPSDHEGRAAAVAEWRAALRVRAKLIDETGMAELAKEQEDG